MPAIDTNVLVRLIIQDDSRQADSAKSFIENGAWVSVLALAEAVWVLSTVYGMGTKDLANAIEMLLNNRVVVRVDPDEPNPLVG